MRCIGAILAKNEANRYLARTIRSMEAVCDDILVLDDRSTDETAEVARILGCRVRLREGEAMWGREAVARAELWAWGAEVAGDGWLYIADADHELVAPQRLWLPLLASEHVNAWGMPLYDCWDADTLHRVDGAWAAYRVARPWLFRPSACPAPQWGERGLHAGHAPLNFPYRLGIVPSGVWLRHLGWMDATDREAKVARYTAAAAHLRPAELAHLHSVSDDRPAPAHA